MNLPEKGAFHPWRPSACLRVSGEDSLTFLQGQFTNDLQQEQKNGAAYGLWLNQKGKVLADSFITKTSPREAWVVSYFSTAAVIRERLEAYIIADDVEITDATADMRAVTLFGLESPMELESAAPAWSFRGRRALGAHREYIFPAGMEAGVMTQLAGQREWSARELEQLRIFTGIPAVPADIGPTDLPNEGRLEKEAISYTKGCYLGQEVMARLKAMGQVRRRLLRVRGPGEPPARLAPVFQGVRKAGELRSVTQTDVGWIGLALVSLVQLDREAGLALTAGGSPELRFLDAS